MGSHRFNRISVYYPRGVRTGGPEALHQLVDALRRKGQDAFLVPMPGTAETPRVPEYAAYHAPEQSEASDRPGDAIVCPEVWIEPVLDRGPAERFLWWLSIDNAQALRGKPLATRTVPSPGFEEEDPLRGVASQLDGIQHLAQSEYARIFLRERLGLEARRLSDYTTAAPALPADLGCRGPLVCYNVAKGGALVRETRGHVHGRTAWQPIVGMSRAQVHWVMSRSDIYLDLGHQPGKDRMPREAAALGAISLVMNQGAGANSRDYPIPDDHRIDPGGDVPRNAAAVVEHILGDIDLHYQRQAKFRDTIVRERETFDREVEDVFVAGSPGHPGSEAATAPS